MQQLRRDWLWRGLVAWAAAGSLVIVACSDGNTSEDLGSAHDASHGITGTRDSGTPSAADSDARQPLADVSPDELADARGLQRMSDWQSLPELEPGRRYRQQTSRDRGTTDTSFPLSGFGNRDFNNFLCASADAQLGASQITPFHFDQAQCAESYVHGVVMGRFEGAGRLVRMWMGMASLLIGPADDELLRIYVDDDPVPRVELPLAAVLDGSAGEIFAPPFGAGSQKRMAWYYPVAFSTKLIVALDRLGDFDEYYFHCDAVYDSADAMQPAEPASSDDRQRARTRLSAVDRSADAFSMLAESEAIELAAGAEHTIELTGPATIQALRVRVGEAELSALADVHVHVRWDDAATEAVDDLSLLELLASSQAPPEGSSQALTSRLEAGDRILELLLPMPFASSARFAFENRGNARATFELSLSGEHTVPAAPFGTLHVLHNDIEAPTEQSDAVRDTVSAHVTGQGRLVGVCGFLAGRADAAGGIQGDPLNLLEGDVRILSDGELALDGTGTEEYADDVFYFTDAPFATAFVAAWGIVDDVNESATGEASFCRWHVLGTEIDFDHSLEVRFELGGAANPEIVTRHHTVSYLYLNTQ